MEYRNPLPTVDLIILDEKRGLLLVERKNPPFGWALPGGFVEEGESLEEAARREGEEETSLKITLLSPFRAFSDPRRDPRRHTITYLFIARGEGEARGGDDALSARWFSWPEIEDLVFAFDHRRILESFLRFQEFLRQREISWEEWGRELLE